MSSLSKKDRVSLCSFTFSDGRRCRTPRIGNHPHFCFYHAQKEARRSRRRKTRQRPGLLLLRRLPLRLRSQHRPVTPHPRRCPRRCKTQNRPHRRLPGPNSPASHPHLPARIHQRLRYRRLARIHPQFRQQQPRLPLPAQTQTARAFCVPDGVAGRITPASTICLRPAIASTRRSNCGSCKCSGRASAQLLASHPTRPTRPTQRPAPIEPASTLRKACRNPRELSFRACPPWRAQRGPLRLRAYCARRICFFLFPRPISNFIPRPARQPTSDRPIHSATYTKQKCLRPPLRPQLPPPPRRQTPLESTLTQRPQLLILNHLQRH